MRVRSSWQVTKSVWHALFMREVLGRLFAERSAGFWLFAEPVLFVAVMVSIRTVVQMMDRVGGVEMVPWMMIGLVAFFMFRDGMKGALRTINSNQALFSYRQVKPVDTVLVRNFVEGFVRTIVLLILLLGLGLLGFDVVPHNFLNALSAWGTVWLLGLSSGLVVSVIGTMVPEVGRIINIISLPLLIISGVMIPIQYLPHNIQELLVYNPIVHGIELVRLGFFQGYWTFPGVSVLYLYQWILAMAMLGLMMHIRFQSRLKAK